MLPTPPVPADSDAPSRPGGAQAPRMEALRREYALSLPRRLLEIEEIRRQLLANAWGADETRRAIDACHELAGTALSFGFSRIGESARSIEAALRAYGADPTPDSRLREAIATQLQHLVALPAPTPDRLEPWPPAQASTLQLLNTPANPQARSVFVVDDNLLVAEQLAMQLQYFGFETRLFGNLAEFTEAYRSTPPDLVVLDIEFPAERDTGPALYKRLIGDCGVERPVVFISNHEDIESRLAAVRAGGARYLVKPVNIGELIDAIDQLTGSDAAESARVLIIDDSPAICHFHTAVLESVGMQVRSLTNPLHALAALSEFQPDLVLIDLYMPECSGMELADVIRQIDTYVGLPIVFLSSEADRNKQLSAMQRGADDFLTKPIEPEHLIATVRNRTARARQMRALMKNDSLTGLLNHISFLDAANIELARARRAKLPCTFAMIDLDHFKSINDTYGHPVGDRVLRGISRQLKQRLRNVDIIGRYGGEEFAILFSNTDGRTALRIINGIREDFARIVHASPKGALQATFSCGLAAYPDFSSLDRMIEAADKGLYESKRRGRNCAVAVTPPPVRAVQ